MIQTAADLFIETGLFCKSLVPIVASWHCRQLALPNSCINCIRLSGRLVVVGLQEIVNSARLFFGGPISWHRGRYNLMHQSRGMMEDFEAIRTMANDYPYLAAGNISAILKGWSAPCLDEAKLSGLPNLFTRYDLVSDEPGISLTISSTSRANSLSRSKNERRAGDD